MHCTYSKPRQVLVVVVGVCHAMTYPPPPPQNEIEFKGGGGCGGGLWTSLQPFLGHFTLKRITNVCLHISCDDIITTTTTTHSPNKKTHTFAIMVNALLTSSINYASVMLATLILTNDGIFKCPHCH